MVTKRKVLVIDDEAEIRSIIRESLSSRYEVLTSASGMEGLRAARNHAPDAILLDILLPDINGIEVAKMLRAREETRSIPIIMLTVVEDDATRARALRSGVDDLVTKPFRVQEFVARIDEKIRRAGGLAHSRGTVVCGNLKIDPATLEARLNGRMLELSVLDFHLLTFLAQHVGRIFDREALLKAVWDSEEVSDRVVDNHISGIRRKLAGFDHDIVTIYGAGYGIKRK